VPALPRVARPTQVRIVPVSEKYLQYAQEIATEVRNAKIRVDIDDRDESVSKKVASAGREWVPYVAVIGEKEEQRKSLAVTARFSGQKEPMSVNELIASGAPRNRGKCHIGRSHYPKCSRSDQNLSE